MTDFETIIVGNGLIGSAAARHLSEFGEQVALIGQQEPSDPATHDGVFASHYDQRRLAHIAGRSAHWMAAKRSAMNDYHALEQLSGISFHDPVGYLMAIPSHRIQHGDGPHQAMADLNIPHSYFPAGDSSWRDRFLEYDFPESHGILYEPAPAGTIDPRAMGRAQNVVAQMHGASIIPALVTDVREEQGIMHVHTRSGDLFRAQKVLLATGAFTSCYSLSPHKLALTSKTEVIILGEVSAADAARLSRLPTAGYDVGGPQIMESYMTPAARHVDGRYFVKLGANSFLDQFTDDLAQIQAWFRAGDSDALLPLLRNTLTTIMPNTNFLSFETKRCIITRTASTYPMIDQVSEGLFVAAGGNGGSAQCASQWGMIAAQLVHGNCWSSAIPRSFFRATFKLFGENDKMKGSL